MNAKAESERKAVQNETTAERKSKLEVVVKRTFNAPARMVFEAWTKPELLKRWWAPKAYGMSLLSCEADVRTGGSYRLVIAQGDSQGMTFFGKYIEVTPYSRLVWTNEEEVGGGAVTTVTFEEKNGQTLLELREVYPSQEAMDASAGFEEGMRETFKQLDELLVTLGTAQ